MRDNYQGGHPGEQYNDQQSQPIHREQARPKREKKLPKHIEEFKNPNDALFEEFLSQAPASTTLDSEINELLMKDFDNNQK